MALRRHRGRVGLVRGALQGCGPRALTPDRRLAQQCPDLSRRRAGGLRLERLLVAAPQEVSRARARQGPALRGRYAGRDRSDGRAPTQARQRLGAEAPVLRPRAKEGVSVRSPPARGAERSYDAIVIGAGHNGLVSAAYLARAGRRVLVLERRPVLGGAAVSEQIFPGFTFSVFSYVVSLLRPEVI